MTQIGFFPFATNVRTETLRNIFEWQFSISTLA